jgi:hypothetical protein
VNSCGYGSAHLKLDENLILLLNSNNGGIFYVLYVKNNNFTLKKVKSLFSLKKFTKCQIKNLGKRYDFAIIPDEKFLYFFTYCKL